MFSAIQFHLSYQASVYMIMRFGYLTCISRNIFKKYKVICTLNKTHEIEIFDDAQQPILKTKINWD